MNTIPFPLHRTLAALLAAVAGPALADAVTDWNEQVAGFVAEARLGTPPAVRVMAQLQTAVRDALEALPATTPEAGTAEAAAVAAAHRAVLTRLLPAQQAGVAEAFRRATATLPEGAARAAGLAAGERAAQAVLAARADDTPATPDTYRPHAATGQYVPTATPAAAGWGQRRPWLLASGAALRPAAPVSTASARWAADFAEVQAYGGRTSARRSAAQTEAARFWDFSLPEIYQGVLRSAAAAPGRDLRRNARLFAAAAQAMDDALIAVFDAKYHHRFWRPVTAIRNADADEHPDTTREPGWLPLIDTPMHPEYPSAHSALAAAVGAVIAADGGTAPVLATRSATLPGTTRRWTHIDDFVREVSDARVHGGVHYRFSTEVGEAIGRQVGTLAAGQLPGAAH